MEFVKLEPERRRSFDEDGFLVVREALDADAVERLTRAADRMVAHFLDKPVIHNLPEYNHIDLRPGLLRDQALRGLVTSSPAVPLLVQLLSPNVHLHSTALICKRPENPELPPFRRGWHRDARIPRDLGHVHLPRVGIKICYCLTDFDRPSCGMTLMARKTHLDQAPLKVRKGEVDPEGVEVCDIQVKAGDAILFENRIFHTAAPNLHERTSKVLMYGYAYRWMKPEVYLDVPEQDLLDKVGPIGRQLLGGYRDIDTPPWALQEWAERYDVAPQPVPWTVQG